MRPERQVYPEGLVRAGMSVRLERRMHPERQVYPEGLVRAGMSARAGMSVRAERRVRAGMSVRSKRRGAHSSEICRFSSVLTLCFPAGKCACRKK